MTNAIIIIGNYLTVISCLGVAAYLAATNKEGWGWFVFVALAWSVSVRITQHKDSGDSEKGQP